MGNLSDVKMLRFSQYGDERGHLVVLEGQKDVPFSIARVFYIYGSEQTAIRGQHANRKTEFVLVNVAGTSKVRVKDIDGNEAVFSLDSAHIGLFLPSMVWKEMFDFSHDSVLLVLASEHYDPKEYIHDYKELRSEVVKSS